MRVVITAAAEADLIEIGEYIRNDNPTRAGTFVGELLDCCYDLTDQPRVYPLVPRYERWNIRRRVHGNYSIFYRVREELVEVVHILHGARDYEAMLFPDSWG
jgi:plasmid stabilization system protein ParE